MRGIACAPSTKTGIAAGVGEGGDALDRQDRAEGVREVRHGDELRARREHALEHVEVDVARLVEGDDREARALLLAEHLPGHDVRVVLEAGDEDLVARADVRAAVGLGHEVDGLGGAAQEDDFVRLARVIL